MQYNFTEQARQTLKQAHLEAGALGHGFVGTEHILLALLEPGSGPAAAVVDDLGLDRPSMRERVLSRVARGEEVGQGGRPYTARAKKILEYAIAEGRSTVSRRAEARVDTDHLLVGLIKEGKGLGAEVLREVGATPERITEAVQRLRGKATPESPASPKGTAGRSSAPAGAERSQVWFLQIDPEAAAPIYEQIIARIEEAVATDRLSPGESLPTVRDLAAELGVAPGTVARAYSALEERGVLETRGARGTRVAERPAPASAKKDVRPALADLLRPIAVAGYHMGARAQDLRDALDLAMADIFPSSQA
jgi:DNA-binding transcriptional regulator YhcF (GntR family)